MISILNIVAFDITEKYFDNHAVLKYFILILTILNQILEKSEYFI